MRIDRINEARKLANKRGLSEHFAESLLYLLINEPCKVQLIQREEATLAPQRIPQSEDELYDELKHNLLRLTEHIYESYDERYSSGFFATREYLRFEEGVLASIMGESSSDAMLLDLGCATGRVALGLVNKFRQVVGFDISQHMISRANHKAEKLGL